jgi:hypothetical protein
MAQQAQTMAAEMNTKRQVKAKDEELKAAQERVEELDVEMGALKEQVASTAKLSEEQVKVKDAEIVLLKSSTEGSIEQMSQQSAKMAELTLQRDGLLEDKKQWGIEIKGLQEREQASFKLKQDAEAMEGTAKKHARDAMKTLRDIKVQNTELQEQNDKLVGHQNPRQKIQLHVKIKEENNVLRDQTEQQRHELRRLHKKLKENGIADDKAEELKPEADKENSSEGEGGKKKAQELAKIRRTLCTIVDRVNEVCGNMDSEPTNMAKLGSNAEEVENLTMSLLEGLEMKQKELTTSTVGKEREIVDLSNQLRLIQFGGDGSSMSCC